MLVLFIHSHELPFAYTLASLSLEVDKFQVIDRCTLHAVSPVQRE